MHIQMAEVINLNPQFKSHDTQCYAPMREFALQTTYMLGLVFIRTSGTFPSSCSAVLTAIHGPLHLQRSQHYQPPPSLRWQRSSFCLPGLQPLPPPALSLLLFTVPETTGLSNIKFAQLGPGMCCLHVEHLFRIGYVHWSVTWCLLRRARRCAEC